MLCNEWSVPLQKTSRWQKSIDRRIPATFRSAEERRRARVIILFGWGFGFANLLFMPPLWVFDWWASALNTFVSGGIMLVSPLVMRRTKSVRAGAVTLLVDKSAEPHA